MVTASPGLLKRQNVFSADFQTITESLGRADQKY